MLDPLLTLIAAKAKAVGLVAGTALVTTALVGGGAVAMTVVSSESDLQEDAAVVQTVEETADVLAVTTSDTGTVGIDPEEPKEPKVRPPLPADFTCDESKNHGQNVSAYAKSLPKGPGRGEKVSAVAQSDCGKKAESAEDEVEAAEAEEASEPKPDQAAKKAAQAERKAARTAEQDERKAAKKAAADERKAAKGGNGKGAEKSAGKDAGKDKD